MSASSCWVTCGIASQLRCRFAPESFLIRESGFSSIGPNFAKSISGIGGNEKGDAAGAFSASLTNDCTSSLRILAFGPLPETLPRSTPNSRASRRTEGPACAVEKHVSFTAGCGGDFFCGGGVGRAGASIFGMAAGSAERVSCGGASALAVFASTTSRVRMGEPSETLSPTLAFSSFTTPPSGEGTSIVALSDSSAIKLSSALMTSPGETSTSMIGTSLKSPMSGTRTSFSAPIAIF